MRQLNGYANASVMTDTEKLPAGGYVLKIMGVKYENGEAGKNDTLIISFDITEGDFKDFYAKQYRANTNDDKKWKGNYRLRVPFDDGSTQDAKTQNIFKTAISCIEESNNGYHWDWDETKLKGKTVGGLFREKEYDYNGRHGFFTECMCFKSASLIREGKFTVPEPRLLPAAPTTSEGFMSVPVGNDDLLPFS